ncbi:hypothetical protein LUZ60_016703 [Juncus effusus]|nr:hypothetical protein LUZ60_016703 [Juncus effusus]
MELDWANLPSELIHLISKKLSDFSDLFSFHSVCKPWHANGSKSDPPHQLPWLLKSRSPESDLTFYSSSFKTLTFRLPEASGKILLGCTNRYFLSLDISHRFLSLFNPITREEISLPFPDGYFDWISPVYIGKEKVVLIWGSNDSENTCLGFCKIGDKECRVVEGKYLKHGHLYFDGKCYVNTRYGGCARIIDEVSGKEAGQITPHETVTTRPTICKAWGGSNYLIEASGEIFLIFRAHDEFSPVSQSYFEIHRLDSSQDSNPKWTQITSIDDYVIFLDQTRGFAIRASELRGHKGNCVYFLKYRVEEYEEAYVVCRYDLEEGWGEELGYEVQSGGSWFIPSTE